MDQSLRTLIEQAEFKESFRGYDRAQVDDTLEQLASQAGKLESELSEASRRLGDAETRIRAEAEAEVEARLKATQQSQGSGAVRDEVADAEEVRLTLVMAQRTADAAIAEARAKAAELLDTARTEALRTTADARSESTRERQEGRKRLAEEIRDLEGVRTVLQSDIQAMEGHVKSERELLSKAIDRLHGMIHDPDGFRVSTPPAPTPIVIPDPPAESPASPQQAAPKAVAPDAAPKGAQAKPVAAAAPVAPTTANAGAASTGSGSKAAADPPSSAAAEGGRGANGATAGAGSAKAAPAPSAPSVDAAHEEDAFLSELRKAMTDDEPRAQGAQPAANGGEQSKVGSADASGDGEKPRFGRRR